MMRSFVVPILLAAAIALPAGAPGAAEPASYTLTLKNHRFQPTVLTVPAGKRFKLIVRNLDATPEEFESKSLNREKVVRGHGRITINIGPLKPGTYRFYGEFHEKTAHGRIVAR
jgi:Cupredoxin-like domain